MCVDIYSSPYLLNPFRRIDNKCGGAHGRECGATVITLLYFHILDSHDGSEGRIDLPSICTPVLGMYNS